MAIIKSGDTADLLKVDPTSKAARVTLYAPDGSALTSAGVRGTALNLRTDGGTDSRDGVAILAPGTAGAVILGTPTNPLRTDPTGTTTQPVSGSVNANVRIAGSDVSGVNPVPVVFPAAQPVAFLQRQPVDVQFPSTQPVTFPSAQPITGSVNANVRAGGSDVSSGNRLPADVTGTVGITGNVNVVNLPDDIGLSLAVMVDIVPSTVTSGTVYFSLRNGGSKTMYVKRLDLQMGFTGTAAASRSSYEVVRYNGTPSGGTAVAAVKKLSTQANSGAAALVAPAGLTVSGVTFDTAFHRVASPNQLTATTAQDVDFGDVDAAKIALLPGEGLAIRANGAVVAGSFLVGSLGWHER